MYILGINAVFHDPAAVLLRDGALVAAAEEERFTHIKHGKRPNPFTTYQLPFHAIDYCLWEAGIRLCDVSHIAYSFDPHLLLGEYTGQEIISLPLEPSAHPTPEEWTSAWDPLFLSSIVNAPRHLVGGVPHHLKKRWAGYSHESPAPWHFVAHHLSHLASAYYPSPFEEAAILSLDGRGELASTSYARGDGTKLEMIGQVCLPHSLGLLYEEVTTHLGFLHSSDEYKVMALASFGKPTYEKELRCRVVLEREGAYTILPLELEEWFGPMREPGSELAAKHFNLARSLQKVLEDTVVELANWLHGVTGSRHLCLAGGVALNCVMNAQLKARTPFEDIWVQPAAGDAGTALGAACWIAHQQEGPSSKRRVTMEHALWGPSFTDDEIESFLKSSKLSYRKLNNVPEETAALLAEDKVIGWFQGRMEFGPRALGARSILASPIHAEMQARLNDIKDREDFRPVAPAVLEEEAGNWFRNAQVSPFMLFVYEVDPARAARIPAVRHTDGTARIQTVRRDQHPLYYDLLAAFQERTGVPVLVNTSFNTRGRPVVCTPRDAVECFWTSPLDALVIGSFCLEKS